MRYAAILSLGGLLLVACSSTDNPNPGGTGATGGASGTGGSSSGTGGEGTGGGSSGGSTGTGGSTGDTGGASGGESGSGGQAGETGGEAGAGDVDSGASAGAGGGDAGTTPTKFTCNTVLGIDTTSEWFLGGFEDIVGNDNWQIIYHHPGYVEDWVDTKDAVWTTAAASACTMNSDNPDRVIFNAVSWTMTTSEAWVTGLTAVVENLKKKYSNLKRVDLLTLMRAPNNTPCVSTNTMSIVPAYVDDAIGKVVAAYPGFVTASPKFVAPNCNVFKSGGPHFTDAAKPAIAKIYGDSYAKEP
jgi:hypothetical protein